MKMLKALFITVLLAVPATGHAMSVNVASANCKQNITQNQNVNCGNISAPLTFNVSGGGNVMIGPTNCYIQAGMSASQQALCMARAG